MSSITPSESFSVTTTPAATAASSQNPFPGASNRGANYFFGFLITFIALLLLFIGCGIGTRRRLQRNGRLLDFSPWDDSSGGAVNLIEPHLIEPRLTDLKDGEFRSWASIQPLSSSMIPPSSSPTEQNPHNDANDHHHNHNSRPAGSSPAPVRMPSSNPTAYHGLSLPVWLPAQREREMASKDEAGPDETDNGCLPKGFDILQVAVLVAMPSQHQHEKKALEDDPPLLQEYQFGVAQVSWDEGHPHAQAR
ncbi:hypothetical protein E1B28_006195 [Marasmius oreades]|uniref:Uncharacterized protein n=1 Tax=Marasmius oreades TaxID=181124 RepID=A0A9P7S6I4_9AGAR|nr:uncharacterized protein E1B28_006195 [Marasmius oreades]KAG7095451.1 hypothetical protein E1B28_006195 [Marasmius oreades]